MGKNRKSKFSSDRVRQNRRQPGLKKITNPFEIIINKEKQSVIGRKLKNDRGLPGVSRSKSIQKRKSTLLREYQQLNKSNRLIDRRIGEDNSQMTKEECATARFQAVRVKTHNEMDLSMGDDELLTHKGKTLADIEKFDDPNSDDDFSLDENESRDKLNSSFVENAHFGGGLLRSGCDQKPRTHKELIEQLILESKKRKAEKLKNKELTLELTEKLDSEWSDLVPIVSKFTRKKDAEESVAPVVKLKTNKDDDYDITMRKLSQEVRGIATDRLKTDDQIVQEEKEQLEKLEQERLQRMKPVDNENVPKNTHRSADDLDDYFVYESDHESEMLTYNEEGEANVKIHAFLNRKKISEDKESVENYVESEGDGSCNEDHLECGTDSNTSGTSEDNLSDLKESDNEEIDLEENCIYGDHKKGRNMPLKNTKMLEGASQDVPNSFTLPALYDNLVILFKGYNIQDISTIVKRMIKCNDPSLNEGNKEKLGALFTYLLQYVKDCLSEENVTSLQNCFELFFNLIPQFVHLIKLNTVSVPTAILEVIKEKHLEFSRRPNAYPGIDLLLFLKLVNSLFSTSDYRHQVATPSIVFIEQMLTQCRVSNRRDVSYGLFLTTLVLEYTLISRRYLPAAIVFLGGLLHMAIPKSGVRLIKVKPPFIATSSLLVLNENCRSKEYTLKMESSDFVEDEIDDSFKVRALNLTLELLIEFNNILESLDSSIEIFSDVINYLEQIPASMYPSGVMKHYKNVTTQLNTRKSEKNLVYIQKEILKPKALRLYEPKIEQVFEFKRHKNQTGKKAEHSKLLHKLKRETKGALREIRRDAAFLSKNKVHQQIKSDKRRAEKVKRIFSEAAIQQSELNSLARKKKT